MHECHPVVGKQFVELPHFASEFLVLLRRDPFIEDEIGEHLFSQDSVSRCQQQLSQVIPEVGRLLTLEFPQTLERAFSILVVVSEVEND